MPHNFERLGNVRYPLQTRNAIEQLRRTVKAEWKTGYGDSPFGMVKCSNKRKCGFFQSTSC